MSGIKALYTGHGYMQGVPARDLTLEEWNALGEKRQELLKDLGVFRLKPGPVANRVEPEDETLELESEE